MSKFQIGANASLQAKAKIAKLVELGALVKCDCETKAVKKKEVKKKD